MTLVDLTRPLGTATPVYPGDPAVEVEPVEAAPGVHISRLRLGTHAGTHMDAPSHFIAGGLTIDLVPLGQCVGEAVLVRCPGARSIDAALLRAYEDAIRRVRKVVVDTGWAAHWGREDYFTRHPVLPEDAARFLIDCGVHLVGVDGPSVDRAPYPAHRVLLGAGAVIVENLANLDRIPGPVFHLSAAPLPVAGGDGAPARVFAVI